MALVAPESKVVGANPHKLTQDWSDVEHAIASGTRRVLLHGIPGTGKTMAAQKAGVEGSVGITTLYKVVRTEANVMNVYLGEETAAYQIVGTDAIDHGTMIWRDGPGLIAWRQEFGRLVVNEIDHASGDTLDALMWLCDDEESARIVLPTGECVKPGVNLQIVATMNGEPQDLPEAIQDRFSTRFRISAPHPAAIAALPEELQKVAKKLSHEGTPESQRVTIRQFRAYAEMIRKGVPKETAARGSFHHRADELLKTIGLAAA
jgi:MoxR-like ATPase